MDDGTYPGGKCIRHERGASYVATSASILDDYGSMFDVGVASDVLLAPEKLVVSS